MYGARGNFERLAELDEILAHVSPTSSAYPISVKLRVDWRVARSQQHSDPALAKEAQTILDDLLASFWSLDIYILRSGCAYPAHDGPAYVESVWLAVTQLKQRLKQIDEGKDRITEPEALQLVGRLSRMIPRLSQPLTTTVKDRAQTVSMALQELIADLRG